MKQDFNPLYVYIIRCYDGSYYTGVTNDLERRVQEHNDGLSEDAYTKKRRPVKLVYWEAFFDNQAAFDWETQIKGWSHAKKTALINGDWDRIKQLSNAKKTSND